jgi:hypothetical protein
MLTHSVFEPIGETSRYDGSLAALKSDAKRLDGVCVTTRSPAGIAGNLTPSEYFEQEDAVACIRAAASICDAARRISTG